MFEWFVIVIMDFLFRLDHQGVNSVIWWPALRTDIHTALLSFFRPSSWQGTEVMEQWRKIILSQAHLIQIESRYLLIGDGIKVSKEAHKVPGVKRLYQESENSGKPEYLYGLHHGVVGVLAGR